MLDESIATEGYVIRPSAVAANYIDLSKIDFELLKKQFETGRKAVEVQKLRSTDCRQARADGSGEQDPDELPRRVPEDD